MCACLYYNNHSSANFSTKSSFFSLKTTNLLVQGGANTLGTGLKGNRAALLVFISSCLEGQYQQKKRITFSAGCELVTSGSGYLLWYHVTFNCLRIHNHNYFTNIKSIFKVDCKMQGARCIESRTNCRGIESTMTWQTL
jgi:hypothetical protein